MRDPFARTRGVVHYKMNELPSRTAWKIPLKISRSQAALLCERLHSIVMDRYGASFYYPNDARNQNLCRYEWHRRIDSNRFGLTVGVDFLVCQDGIEEIEIYATTSDAMHNLIAPSEALNEELRRIAHKEAIRMINRALQGLDEKKTWFFIFHVEAPSRLGFSQRSIFGEEALVFLPTRILKDFRRVSVAIVRAEAASKVSARDTAFAKLTTACALLTLSEGKRYEVAKLDPSMSRPTIEVVKSIGEVKEDRLYPLRKKWPKLEEVDGSVAARFSWVWSAFSDLTPEAAEKFSGPLFAFYGATIRNHDLSTLSAVGYMAALSALASGSRVQCKGDVSCSLCGGLSFKHDTKGEVPAIVDALCHLLGASEVEKIKAMLRRTYSNQRSSFVHGARHRHEEYGQGPQIPAGLPTEKTVVQQERLDYGDDLQSLAMLTRSALLHLLASLSRRRLDRDLFDLRHFTRLENFTYLGLPRLVEARLMT